MSRKYKHGDHVPTAVLAARLEELARSFAAGGEERDREFTMRIPAELDRDPDLVMSEAAKRLALAEELVRRIRFAESELHPKENQRIDWFDLDDAWRDILEGAEAFEQSGEGQG